MLIRLIHGLIMMQQTEFYAGAYSLGDAEINAAVVHCAVCFQPELVHQEPA
jgi:hypothetical protein